MEIDEILKTLIDKDGSDLHLKNERPPIFRIKGDLVPSEEFPAVSSDEIKTMVSKFITSAQTEELEKERELDFSCEVKGLARFRGNLFHQKGNLGAVFRAIPCKIPTIEDMELPEVFKELAAKTQGIILVTGPTGSGKSTTLAAIIEYMNQNMRKHIITIEDPVEFVYKDKKALINQRQVGLDTKSFSQALRRALRQDPDVILVGEMRDAETISIAMSAAETGHLVLSTLHTNDCKQTLDRIIDTFPPEQHHQIRMQFAATLEAAIAQQLLKRTDKDGRIGAYEIMINTPHIRKLIEDAKAGQILKTLEESASFYGTQSFNQALLKLLKEKKISQEEAVEKSNNPNDLKIKLQTAQFAGREGTM